MSSQRHGTRPEPRLPLVERLRLFDEASERQRARQAGRPQAAAEAERGWKREELYVRGKGNSSF